MRRPKMPTPASSPHVRINRETHEKLRLLSYLRRQPQGEIVDALVDAELEAMGNPQQQIEPLPTRQKSKVK